MHNNEESAIPNLNTNFQEADSAIPLHVLNCFNSGYEKVLVLSNDTDIDVTLLYYIPVFLQHGMKELWMQAGAGLASRYIPLHILYSKMGSDLCAVLPALYTLTGCDSTSKVGTKKAALESNAESLLVEFGKHPILSESISQQAEKYLVNVIKKNSVSETFTDLRKEIYKSSISVTHLDLPPTSEGLLPHIQRSHYNTYINTHLLDAGHSTPHISALDNGYEMKDGLLMPRQCWKTLEAKWTVTCKCKKCARLACLSRASNINCVTFCRCTASTIIG